MSFNPNLESNIGFTQAVEQPNAMGAIAGLFNNLGVFDRKQTTTAKPTEDEQFAAAWESFSSAQGVALDPNNPNYNSNIKTMAPAFLRQFPQFGSQVSSMMSASGIQLPMDVETYRQDAEAKAAIDMQAEFKFSPRGMMADANARSYATDENGNFNQNKYNEYYNREQAKHYATQAEITALTEQAGIAENRTKVGASYWESGKDFANTFIQTQLAGLSEIMVDIQDGTAEITPEMAAMFNMKPGKITAQNFYIALQSYRPTLARMLKDSTAGELASAGADIDILSTTNPDKAWFDEVMGPIDSLIKVAETNFGDVSKTLKTLQDGDALTTLQTIKQTDPDLYSRINVANAVPPELRTQVFSLFTEKGESWNRVANALSLTFGATGETPEGTAARIEDMAKPDAEAALEFSLGVVETGKAEGDNLRNATMTVFGAMDRVKPNEFFGYDTFKALTKNAKGIAQEAAADPVFGNYVEQKMLADLNKNFKALTLQTQGNPNLSIVMENGQLSVVSSGGQTVVGMRGQSVDQSTIEFNEMEVQRIMESPEFIGLQNKLNDMKAFGPMGDKISEAFSMENKLTPEQTQVNNIGVSNGQIAQSLNIDFGQYETAYNLPVGYLERTAFIESRGNPNAVSSTGATGLFQFTQGTAADYNLVDRNDPIASTDAAARLAAANAAGLRSALGREPNGAELYLAHQQGLGGAKALLAGGAMNVVDALLPVYKGNRARAEQAIIVNGGNVNMTAGEFANIWISKYNGARGATKFDPAMVRTPSERLTAVEAPTPNYIDRASVDLTGGSQVAVQSVSGAEDTPLVDQAIDAQGGSQATPEASQARMQAIDPQVQALITALVQDGRLTKGEKIKIGDKEIEVA